MKENPIASQCHKSESWLTSDLNRSSILLLDFEILYTPYFGIKFKISYCQLKTSYRLGWLFIFPPVKPGFTMGLSKMLLKVTGLPLSIPCLH